MPAGTITLTNNSATITGVGTSFTTELVAGDFIIAVVGGIPYNLPIKIVNSNTQLTAISNYIGPSASGLSFLISPRDAQNLITAGIVVQNTEALRGLNYDKQNWQQVYSSSGSITVTLPDGSAFTGPSWKYLAENAATKVSGAVPIAQGGTGATTVEGARTTLGLGSASTRDVGTGAGNLMETGAFGLGTINPPFLSAGTLLDKTGWATARANEAFPTPTGAFMCLTMRYDENSAVFHAIDAGTSAPQHYFRVRAGGLGGWSKYWTTVNTTKASDGTLKAASPVARVIKSQEETGRTDACEEGFTWCGCGAANAEAEGISISRLDVGVYLLTGSAGLASEGWQLLPPMDPGGMGELGVVEAEETESGGITIRLFKRRYMIGEDGDIVKTKGVPMDVPANSWIDVRLDMPADSIWNKKQKSAQAQ